MAASSEPAPTLRRTASTLTLLRLALGGREQVREKVSRARRTLRLWRDARELDRRLERLVALGRVERKPSRLQLAFGSWDMFRWVIVPAARDYYAQQGIDFSLHQVLRVLDDPVSVLDPTGLLSERDTVIGHLMQVVHLNPIYDLQLLELFEDGLAELERQVASMVSGSHPRAGTIGAIVEDAGYHARLLEYVRAYRVGGPLPDLVRPSTLRGDPHFAAAEKTFASMPGFLHYCLALPDSLPALLRRRLEVARFPLELTWHGGEQSAESSRGVAS